MHVFYLEIRSRITLYCQQQRQTQLFPAVSLCLGVIPSLVDATVTYSYSCGTTDCLFARCVMCSVVLLVCGVGCKLLVSRRLVFSASSSSSSSSRSSSDLHPHIDQQSHGVSR